MFLIYGCAAVIDKVVVVDNNLYSSTPELKVKVSPEFEFIGSVSAESNQPSVDGTRQLKNTYDACIFLQALHSKVKKGIAIEFRQTETFFTSDLYGGIKNKVDSGYVYLAGKTYQYYVSNTYPSEQKYISKYAMDKGYTLNCGLTETAARVVGSRKNILISIGYYESLDGSGFSCEEFKNISMLREKHIEFIKGFKQRFHSAFRIIQ
jgi:hypothetical protein